MTHSYTSKLRPSDNAFRRLFRRNLAKLIFSVFHIFFYCWKFWKNRNLGKLLESKISKISSKICVDIWAKIFFFNMQNDRNLHQKSNFGDKIGPKFWSTKRKFWIKISTKYLNFGSKSKPNFSLKFWKTISFCRWTISTYEHPILTRMTTIWIVI